MARLHTFHKYLLAFLLAGSVLAINPWLTTDVFEFPKVILLIFWVGILTLLSIVDFASLKAEAPFFHWKKLPRPLFFLGIFFVAQLLAYIFSVNPKVSLMGDGVRFQGLLMNIEYVLLVLNTFYFFARFPQEKTQFLWKLMQILAVVECLLALLPYVFPLTFPFYLFTPAFFAGRVYGTFGNPNYLAAFLITVLPFVIFDVPGRAVEAGQPLKKFLAYPLVALIMFTLFLTGSRSAWIALLLAFLGLGIIQIIKDKQYKIMAVVFGIVLFLALGFIFKSTLTATIPQASRLSFDTANSTSLKTRLHLWKAGIKMALQRPITGYGQETIKGNIEPYLPEYLAANDVFFIDRTHSELIDIFVTQGSLGLIGYLGFFGLIFWRGAVRLFQNGLKQSSPLLVATFTGLVALFLFHAVNFSTTSSNTFLYLLSALLYVL
ncbi:MAG: O-antigen ligase family protein [Patescibacteria group bacterium]